MSELNERPACPHCAEEAAAVPEAAPAAEETAAENSCCRHKSRSPEETRALLNRLSRIEGQIRGVRKMVEDDVYCTDILIQASAAKSALNGFTRELVEQHLGTCVADDLKNGSNEKLKEFIWILNKLV